MIGTAWLVAGVLAVAPPPAKVSARVALAVDVDTGEVLAERGCDRPHAIASLTKLMALKVIWQHGLDLDGATIMIAGDYEVTKGGARSRLVTGRPYRNRDLLHAALLGSDNRAVIALGRAVGLPYDALVAAMNAEARQMGLTHMHFVDPTGIDHGNVALGTEVVALMKAVMDMPTLAAVTRTQTWLTESRERSGRPLQYRNTNLLVHDDKRQVLVGKTGFNSAAGWSVATIIQQEHRRLGVVVLGTTGKYLRFRDAKLLEKFSLRRPRRNRASAQ